MVELSEPVDVLVAGGGNAALCAALAAREAGARVLVLESAPESHRGGNSRHTRNLRCMHDAPTAVLTEAYGEAEYLDDLLRVTGGATDEALARLTIRGSAACTGWMQARGVRFQPALSGTLHLNRTNAFFLGGGKALLNAYYRAAAARGIAVLYEAEVQDVALRAGRFDAATVLHRGRTQEVRAGALIAASGGFEANLEWLREAWGAPADNFLIRGTPYNRGRLLRALLDQGVRPTGDPTAVPCGRDRCPGAEVRRRHRDPGRLRLARHRGQPPRPALLRRGRGLLAQALRHLGPPGRRAAGADRLCPDRPEGGRALHAHGVPAAAGGLDPRARDAARARSRRPRGDRAGLQRRGATRRLRPHPARRLPDRGPRAAQEPLGAAARHAAVSTATRCARASPSPISASRSTSARGC